jgi:UDP-2,4-diacetamido-2,4,6-trideoxy-beta-L-altropyranose hydrolase
MKTLLIRVDSDKNIGAGHVMRCLALAQAWRDNGGQVLFVLATKVLSLEARLVAEGMQVIHLSADIGSEEDARQTVQLARQFAVDWLILDGYHFDEDYQRALKQADLRVLCIDDYGHANYYYADWILNQNISADELYYMNRESYTRLLLGSRYVLLRKEFFAWRSWQHEIVPVARKVLVTLGGSDPDNATAQIFRALRDLNLLDLEVRILVGPMNPNLDALRLAVGDAGSTFQLLTSATNIPELMAWADLAISGGGSTFWELAFMGVPTLVVVLAENQLGIAESLAGKRIIANLGWHQQLTRDRIVKELETFLASTEQRLAQSERARALIDGDGVARVIMNLKGEKFRLRKACVKDARLVWEMANELSTRAVSFSSDMIPWDTHVEWFNAKLKDPNCQFFIAVDEQDVTLGQIRFDVHEKGALVSVSLAANCRGRGYGEALIRQGSAQVFRETNIDFIKACIKPENTTSARAFFKAGYQLVGDSIVKGHFAQEYIFSRNNN